MPWLYYKQIDGHFDYVMGVITMRVLYLEHTPPIEKQPEQKKFLKAFPIMQRQAPPHNKRLPIFVLPTILKTFFSKIKISIMNNYDFDNKT